MRILVTGGAGFIGTAVLEYAQQHHPEHEYRAFDLAPCPLKGVEIAIGSILDSNQVSKAMRGCGVVIHLAALLGVHQTDSLPLECLMINTEGTIKLLEAAAREHVTKFVFASSSEVYGSQREQPIAETRAVSPLSVYGISKLAAEEYVKAYALRYGFQWSIARFFNVYGTRQQPMFVVPRFVQNVARGEAPVVYGDGSATRAFCNVRDIAGGMMKVTLEPNADGDVFNIGNDRWVVTMKELAQKVIQVSGSNLEPVFLPYAQSDRRPERDPERRIPDISKAKRLLGYNPQVTLEEGLSELFDHYVAKETAVAV